MAKRTKVKDIDITKSGPMTFRDLQKANQEPYTNLSPEFKSFSMNVGANTAPTSLYDAGVHGEQMVQSSLEGTATPWGESMFDEPTATEEEFSNLGDIRAENQPWYSQIGNGLAKGAVLAGTTFLDGTVGLLVGAGTAIDRGEWSGLWDNDFSKAMQTITEKSEELMPNYYTKEEQERPFWENIFTANFIGDKFIKNLGFTVGAIYSGGVVSNALRGASKLAITGAKRLGASINTIKNMTNATPIVSAGIGSFTSALNEGRIEALNNSKDWFELHKAQLDDEHAQRIQAIQEQYGGTEMYNQMIAAENEGYEQTIGKLTEDRLKMGNADLLMNLPILMASNLIQFGKYFANGFKTARKNLNILGKPGEYVAGDTKKSVAPFVMRNALAEGSEEISQGMASRISGDYYSTDVNNFYKSKTDPDASLETLNWLKSAANGINETINDNSAWEEFFIGALTGALGVPKFRGMRNSEGNLQSPVTIYNEGIRDWREHNEKVARENEVADYMNNRLSSPDFLNYYQGLIRHNKYQNDMNQAAEQGDEFNFKNAEHAQLVSDITMFDNAGKIEDLKSAINETSDTSLESLESIVMNTTTKDDNGNLIGPFAEYASTDDQDNIVANFGSQESIDNMTEKLNSNKKDILDTIKNYQDIKNSLQLNYGDKLNSDQLSELTYIQSQIENWKSRRDNMVSLIEKPLRAELVTWEELEDNLAALLNSKNSKEFVENLRNKEVLEKILEEILPQSDMSPIDVSNTIQTIKDIVKTQEGINTFNTKLKEYLANPQKQAEDHIKADEQVAQRETKKKSDSLKTSLNTATTLRDFRTIVESQDDAENRDKVLEEMENEGSEMAKNYRETSQYNSEVRRVINESDVEPQVKQDAIKLLQDQFNNSENLEQIANPNSIYINNGNAFDEDSNGDVDLSATRFLNAQYELQRAMSKISNDNRLKDRFSPEYRRPVERIRTLQESFEEVGLKKGEYLGHIQNNSKTQTAGDKLRLTHTQAEIIRKKARGVFENPNATIQQLHDAIVSTAFETSAPVNTLSYLYKVLDKVKTGKMSVDEAMAFLEYHLLVDDDTHKNLMNNLDKRVKGVDKDTIGDSGTSTIPDVNDNVSGGTKDNTIVTYPEDKIPAGNITKEMVAEENKQLSDRVEMPEKPKGTERRKFYRPAIPELHIEASKEGDFRPFDAVAFEREGADFSIIYNYLKDNGVFEYLNKGNLKAGDEIGFMIDPEFEKKVEGADWHKAPTIFLINKKDGHIVGSLDESGYSVSRYEGLTELEERIRKEYAEKASQKTITRPTSDKVRDFIIGETIKYYKDELKNPLSEEAINTMRNTPLSGLYTTTAAKQLLTIPSFKERVDNFAKGTSKDTQSKGKFIATPTTKVSKMMTGKISYGNEEKSLKDIPNVSRGRGPIFGIIRNGVIVTNGGIDNANDIINPSITKDKEGRLYLLIPNGAGKYSPVAVRVKHFNKEEFDINDINLSSTVLGESIKEGITDLSNALSQEDVSKAMQKLGSNIHLQDVHIAWYDTGAEAGIEIRRDLRNPNREYRKVIINGEEHIESDKEKIVFVSRPNADTLLNIGSSGEAEYTTNEEVETDKDEVIKKILNVLYRFNLPIQVSARSINTPGYNVRYINANVLTSNITDALVKGTWFTTEYFDSEGNLQSAINPASITRQDKNNNTPVGGTNSVIKGTKIKYTEAQSLDVYDSYVDLTTNTIRDFNGKDVTSSIPNDVKEILFDLAWAQDNFGDASNSSIMVDNKIVTPSGKVLDRTNKWYLDDNGAQEVKDVIAGRKKEKEAKVKESNRVIDEIYENQKKVDKTRTDKDFYYVLEDDGQYHQYSRVHSRIGSNFEESKEVRLARINLKEFEGKPTHYNNYLSRLEKIFKLDLSQYKNKTDAENTQKVIDKLLNSNRSLQAGTAVDSIIRQYFTIKDISKIERPDNISEKAFIDLITKLNEVKSKMESKGERFFADNIVLFQKYPDGTRIAGEVDILSIDSDGNFRIYDVKTGGYSFTSDRGLNLFKWTINGSKVTKQEVQNYIDRNFSKPFKLQSDMSTEDYYTLQLSAYKNLFESQYGVPVTKLAIMPFVLTYDSTDKNKVAGIQDEKGIPITYNPSVNVPLIDSVKDEKPKDTPAVAAQQQVVPIFDSSLELQKPIEDLSSFHSFERDNEKVGYFELEGKLHKGYILPLTTVDGIDIYVTKVPNITRGLSGKDAPKVASNNYYVVFPNGKAVLVAPNTSINNKLEESLNAIKEALGLKPQKVKDFANEKTILFDPSKVEHSTPKVKKTSATINQGANISVQELDALNSNKKLSRRRPKLRAVDDNKPTWNQKEELEWLDKVLPQLSREDRVKVVKGLIKVADNGTLAWGQFDNGIITLSDIAAKGTVYHEAFHVVFNLLLDQNERQALYDEARRIYGNKDNLSLEEDMAEGFREYVMTRQNRGLGRRILDFFKDLFAKVTHWNNFRPYLTSYYQSINEGRYANSNFKVPTIDELRGTSLNTTSFNSLSESIREMLIQQGWTEESFNSISQIEKGHAVKCVAF